MRINLVLWLVALVVAGFTVYMDPGSSTQVPSNLFGLVFSTLILRLLLEYALRKVLEGFIFVLGHIRNRKTDEV